eukprot:TRINITY_DN64460_c0_g1_i1.p1 TRINITY_DN64460_c0_g1~~TRINITY_DN64460_c0_g1_i1.p1  ORF type:complete len:420 (-),score=86.46 TRINITY_DN64460_c0_g1_i1:170-1429(-)
MQVPWAGYGMMSGNMATAYAATAASPSAATYSMVGSYDAQAYCTAPASGLAPLSLSSCLDASPQCRVQAGHSAADNSAGGMMTGCYASQASPQGGRMWFPPGNFNMSVMAGMSSGVADVRAVGSCAAPSQMMAASPPQLQAPSIAALPAAKPPPPGMSFGELEARLQSSWECWAQTTQPSSSGKEEDPREKSSQPTALNLAEHIAAPEEEPCDLQARPRLKISRSPLQAFRKEGLFCPWCASRSACSFHGLDGEPEPFYTSLVVAAACIAPEAASVLRPEAAASSSPSTGKASGSSKVEDSSEETSTEAGSSEPWYAGSGSDEWSDAGDWTSTRCQESPSASRLPLFVEELRPAPAPEAASAARESGVAGKAQCCSSPQAAGRTRCHAPGKLPSGTAASLQQKKVAEAESSRRAAAATS